MQIVYIINKEPDSIFSGYLIKNYSNQTESDGKTSIKWQSSKVVIINVEDKIIPDGVIEVKGYIGDKYWIDVENGYLRVATSGRKYVSKVIVVLLSQL